MKFVIICNGDEPTEALLRKECEDADQIICCDGGANVAEKYAIIPNLMVGDFDSLGEERARNLQREWQCEQMQLPIKKDKTDTQVAVELAMTAGAKSIVLLGALGGRFDHALANVLLLIKCEQQGVEAKILDEKNEIYVTCRVKVLDGNVGDHLSILPLGVNSCVRCTDGLAYPLYDHDLDIGDTLSMSNEYDANEALIEVSKGWVCIMRSRD